MKRSVYSKYYDDDLVFNHLSIVDSDSRETMPHSHATYELFYLKDGEISYTESSKFYSVKPNSLILTRPGNIHSITFESNNYDRYDVMFDKGCLYSNVLNRIPNDLVVINCANFPQIAEIFKKMDIYYGHFTDDDLKKILMNLIEEIFYIIIAFDVSSAGSSDNFTENPIITKAIGYIDEHLHDTLTLDMLCEELHITKSYLHQLFTSYLHISPKKYINSKRLAMAQETIRLGSNPTDIYSKYGFSDYTTFYRGYKKYFGYPPSEEISHYISVKSLS